MFAGEDEYPCIFHAPIITSFHFLPIEVWDIKSGAFSDEKNQGAPVFLTPCSALE
jgi:hypothetical protein